MPQPLTVAVAQPETVPHDVAVNALRHAEAIAEAAAAGARLVVFPELSLTGYEFAADPLDPNDARLDPIAAACAAHDAVALVGAPVRDAAGKRIAMLRIGSAGREVVYRKQWVGDDEAKHFAPGAEAVAIEVDGWRVGLGICRDTGIPEHVSDVAALDVDLYAAGIVFEPEEFERLRLRGPDIARRCGAPVALASFAGPTGEGYERTLGASTIWSAEGDPLASADEQPGRVISATLVAPTRG